MDDEEWAPDDRRWRFVWRDEDIVWLTGPMAERPEAEDDESNEDER